MIIVILSGLQHHFLCLYEVVSMTTASCIHNNTVYMCVCVWTVPMHPGAQRFYHSQQLAPVFEVPPSTGMEIYDVYQFGGKTLNFYGSLISSSHLTNRRFTTEWSMTILQFLIKKTRSAMMTPHPLFTRIHLHYIIFQPFSLLKFSSFLPLAPWLNTSSPFSFA